MVLEAHIGLPFTGVHVNARVVIVAIVQGFGSRTFSAFGLEEARKLRVCHR